MRKIIRVLAPVWGVAGVALLLGFAVYRLLPFVVELSTYQLQSWHVAVGFIWCVFMLYSEGYKAFYQQFAPRVVARASVLPKHATLLRVILAPLFCIGYFGAPKHRVLIAYGLAAGIIALIVLVHFVAQPWRGIIDSGVVLGLVAGILSLVWWSFQQLRGPGGPLIDPEITER